MEHIGIDVHKVSSQLCLGKQTISSVLGLRKAYYGNFPKPVENCTTAFAEGINAA